MMNPQPLFKETQRFNQWWFWIPLSLLMVYVFYGIAKQLLTGEAFGDKPLSNTGVIVLGVGFCLVLALFWFMKLETLITREGIYVRHFPFHLKSRFIAWDRITKCHVRQYKPLLEYGGWGIRYGIGGKAYNVSGNQGLQLEYDSNEKLLIGTEKAEELNTLLKKLFPEKFQS